jgi:hypothetical protein
MNPTLEGVFVAVNGIAFVGWVMLVALPKWDRGTRIVAPVIVPGLLAVAYIVTMAVGLPGAEGSFMSLAGVGGLLSRPVVLLGGWIHYLAFDLVVGSWELRDSQRAGLPHAAVVPCMILTFMLGPAGLLAYLAVRAAARKRLAV